MRSSCPTIKSLSADLEEPRDPVSCDFDLIERWVPLHAGEPETELYRSGEEFWLLRPDLGGARFTSRPDVVLALPAAGVEVEDFEQFVRREWLAYIYNVWGRQVLHASAACHLETASAVGFCGRTGRGKSTLGFALGQLEGWRQLSDDVLALSMESGDVDLVPIPDSSRLRSPSAEHFGGRPDRRHPIDWPGTAPNLRFLYSLLPRGPKAGPVRISPVSGAEAFPYLLEQSFVLSTEAPDLRTQMMRDFMDLAAAIEVFELSFPKRLDHLDLLVQTVVEHALG